MINKIKLAKLLNFLEDNNFDLENLETNENTIKLEISNSNQLKIHRVDEKEQYIFNPLDYGFEYDKNENYFIKEIRAVNGATLRAFIMRTKEREPNKNWYFEEQDKIQNITRPCLFTEINKSYIEHELKKYGAI